MGTRGRVRIGFFAAAVLMTVVGAVSYRSIVLLSQTERWVSHTHQVRAEIEAVLSDMDDAETSQRGFLLTRRA